MPSFLGPSRLWPRPLRSLPQNFAGLSLSNLVVPETAFSHHTTNHSIVLTPHLISDSCLQSRNIQTKHILQRAVRCNHETKTHPPPMPGRPLCPRTSRRTAAGLSPPFVPSMAGTPSLSPIRALLLCTTQFSRAYGRGWATNILQWLLLFQGHLPTLPLAEYAAGYDSQRPP